MAMDATQIGVKSGKELRDRRLAEIAEAMEKGGTGSVTDAVSIGMLVNIEALLMEILLELRERA